MKITFLSLFAVLAVGFSAAPALAAPADVLNDSCKSSGGSQICQDRDNKLFGKGSLFEKIINVVIGIIGSVSVLMIVIGGLRYTLSGGDSGNINSAKNTILYAIVGLIVAVMSYAIVNFVIGKI